MDWNALVWKSVRYGVSKELDTAYWRFLGVGTTFDIFQNIHILYLRRIDFFWIWRIDLHSFVVIGALTSLGAAVGNNVLLERVDDDVPLKTISVTIALILEVCLLKMGVILPGLPNPAHNSNFSLLSALRKERLIVPNYMDWMRNLRFTLRYENKENVSAKASKECLDVVKSLMACKPKPGASICAFILEMKGYFDRLGSLNMVFDAELSINIILSGLATDYNQFATKGKSNHGSKRKAKFEIAPTSDPKEAVCFYCNTKGHWKRSCPKYLKDLKDGKVKKGSHSRSKGK
ncbi:retrotransposon protein, putative, ty1-copia subclass [Tanacetum coccineum]|uniref:Retrotransposon protein, putative, ty1-copia subclass n=1 Tax=Tanacetum coccineum TaxID=301880 RepID=A0ABQ4Z7W5_9ASTR